MRIGVPKEIKADENRVGLVPACVRELTARGHEVVVETGAGQGAGLSDAAYVAAGAEILPDAAAVFGGAEMIVKVKEPQPAECAMLRPDQLLFTYLHLAADPSADRGALPLRLHRDRLRDHHRCRRPAAAAGADVARSRGAWRSRPARAASSRAWAAAASCSAGCRASSRPGS